MAGKPLVRPLRFYIWSMFLSLVKIGIAVSILGIAVIGSLQLVSFVERITGSMMYSRFVAILLALLWLSVILGAVVQFLDEQKAIADAKREAAEAAALAARAPRPRPTFPPAPGPTIPPKKQ